MCMKYRHKFLLNLYFLLPVIFLLIDTCVYIGYSYQTDDCTVICNKELVKCKETDAWAMCNGYKINIILKYKSVNYSREFTELDYQDVCDEENAKCYYDKNMIKETLNYDKKEFLLGPLFGIAILFVIILILLPITIYMLVKFCKSVYNKKSQHQKRLEKINFDE